MKTNLFINLLALLFCFNLSAKQSADNVFTDYQIVNNTIPSNLQTNSIVEIDLGTYGQFSIDLIEQNFFSNSYNRVNATSHFTGEVINHPNSKVSLTLNDDFVMGFIQLNNERIFIEPAYFYSESDELNQLIIYSEQNVLPIETSCAHQHLQANQNRISQNSEYNNAMATCENYVLEIAIAADYLMYQELGNNEVAVINLLESINNMSQPYFDNEFANSITFQLVETQVETSFNQFNLLNTTDGESILDDLIVKQDIIWDNPFDIGILWTKKNIQYEGNYTTVGLAKTNSICGNSAFIVNEYYTTNSIDLVGLNCHEIGHVLGAQHDVGPIEYMMTSASNSLTWSPTSINVINNKLQSTNCQCTSGDYFDLSIDCQLLSSYTSSGSKYIFFDPRVYNIGNIASDPAAYKIFLSSDNIVSNDDIEIFSINIPSVPASSNLSFNVDNINISDFLTNLPNGTYNVLFQVGANINDAFPDNNQTGSCLTVEASTEITNVNVVGNNFDPGNNITVTWEDNIPSSEQLRIRLYKGGEYVSVLTTTAPATGAATVTLPGNLPSGNDYQVQVYLYNNLIIADDYSSYFSIASPSITNVNVTTNNIGPGDAINVTWTDNIPNNELLRIRLFKGGVYVTVLTTTALATGSTTVNLPSNLDSGDDYEVQVYLYDNLIVTSDNSPYFEVGAYEISNISVANNNIKPGDVITVNWIDNIPSSENLRIRLYKAGVSVKMLTTTAKATGTANVTVPTNISSGNDYSIRIYYYTNKILADDYGSNFQIIGSSIANTFVTGNNFQAGGQITINWQDNIPNTELLRVRLYNGDTNFTMLSTTVPAANIVTLTLPSNLVYGNDYKIRIYYYNNSRIETDDYSNTFTIFGSAKLDGQLLPIEATIHPNPVINSTTINLQVSKQNNLNINLYNVTGKLIKNIAPLQNYKAGNYQFELNMNDLAKGIYYCSFITDDKVVTKKILKIN